MNKLYVIIKKYPSLNMTIICLRYGKTAKYGGEFDQDDCFTSKKAAVDAINHFQRIGSSARYRVVEASSVGTVNITKWLNLSHNIDNLCDSCYNTHVT